MRNDEVDPVLRRVEGVLDRVEGLLPEQGLIVRRDELDDAAVSLGCHASTA
jgi:hypothetical protein